MNLPGIHRKNKLQNEEEYFENWLGYWKGCETGPVMCLMVDFSVSLVERLPGRLLLQSYLG
jgi:hypothetical protein